MIFICRVPACRFNTCCIKQFDKHFDRHTPHTPYACIFGNCSYATDKRKDFDIHQRKHARQHPPEPKTFPSPCLWPACVSVPPDIKKYRRHVQRHTFDKPFVCGYLTCHYKFSRYEDLVSHYDSHPDTSENVIPRKRKLADRRLNDTTHNIQPSASFERSPSLEPEPSRKRRAEVYVSVPCNKQRTNFVSRSRDSMNELVDSITEGPWEALGHTGSSPMDRDWVGPSARSSTDVVEDSLISQPMEQGLPLTPARSSPGPMPPPPIARQRASGAHTDQAVEQHFAAIRERLREARTIRSQRMAIRRGQ